MIARNEAGIEVPTGGSAVFCGEHVSLVLTGIEQVKLRLLLLVEICRFKPDTKSHVTFYLAFATNR